MRVRTLASRKNRMMTLPGRTPAVFGMVRGEDSPELGWLGLLALLHIQEVANQQCLSYMKCKKLRCNLMPEPQRGYGRSVPPAASESTGYHSVSTEFQVWLQVLAGYLVA
ncbi:uncharacterized protein LJ206_006343 isoform 2-T4 [Theristicus caerulescens]